MTRALLPKSAEESPVDVRRPILICGVGRSGTSLLQSMLNAHPHVAVPPETHFFRRYVAAGGTRTRVEGESVAAFAAELAQDEDFLRAEQSPEDALAAETDHAIDPVRVYRRILAHWARRSGKSRVGDKDPRNLDVLEDLHGAFPDAVVLHIIRDPRSVVYSRTKAEWSASRPWWSHALIAQEQLRRGRRVGRELFGESYHEVLYENLLADPAAALRRVADACGVAFDAAMLDFGASARSLVAASEVGWKKETFGPLLADNATKWKEGLSRGQVNFIERVCVEAFDHLGYERSLGGAGARPVSFGMDTAARSAFSVVYGLRRRKEGSR